MFNALLKIDLLRFGLHILLLLNVLMILAVSVKTI